MFNFQIKKKILICKSKTMFDFRIQKKKVTFPNKKKCSVSNQQKCYIFMSKKMFNFQVKKNVKKVKKNISSPKIL